MAVHTIWFLEVAAGGIVKYAVSETHRKVLWEARAVIQCVFVYLNKPQSLQ